MSLDIISRQPKFRKPVRLVNMQFRLRDEVIISKTGVFLFVLYDPHGEYSVYDATQYPRWLIHRMWRRGDILVSPKLSDYLFSYHDLINGRVKQVHQFAAHKHD